MNRIIEFIKKKLGILSPSKHPVPMEYLERFYKEKNGDNKDEFKYL